MLYSLTSEEHTKLIQALKDRNIAHGIICPFGAIIGTNTKIVIEEDYDMLYEPHNYMASIKGQWIYIGYDFRRESRTFGCTLYKPDGTTTPTEVTLPDIIICPASGTEKKNAEYKDSGFIINLIENLIEVGML